VLLQTDFPSRRFNSRFEALGDVWVYWQCDGGDDTSRVRNLGVGGLFIETRKPTVEGTKARLEFLVQEGQIRADAVVRHVQAGHGLGLKFTALSDGDRPRLAALMGRFGNLSQREPKAFWLPSRATI
jgi:PilZ domain